MSYNQECKMKTEQLLKDTLNDILYRNVVKLGDTEIIDAISNMSVEELYVKNKFHVDCENGVWYLYKEICYYSGCDIGGVPFMTEEDALKEGMRLTLQGERPKISYCIRCCEKLGIMVE